MGWFLPLGSCSWVPLQVIRPANGVRISIRHFCSVFYSAFYKFTTSGLWLFFNFSSDVLHRRHRRSSSASPFSRLVAHNFFVHYISLDSPLALYSSENTFRKVQPVFTFTVKVGTGAFGHSIAGRRPVLATPFRFSGLSSYRQMVFIWIGLGT